MEIIELLSDDESSAPEDPIIIKNFSEITIKQSDYDRLEPQRFLNDNLIDFFLEYMIRNKKDFYAFNSFFYNTLTSQGYEKVKKWFKKTNLFSRKYWLIPVAVNDHWVLIIVANPKNAFSDKKPDPTIFFFDSLGLSSLNPVPALENFILSDWNSRGNKEDHVNLQFFDLSLPLQTNCWDCGVFLLEYAEKFIESPTLFNSELIEYYDLSNWFDPRELEEYKRLRLKNHLLKISFGIADDISNNSVVLQLKITENSFLTKKRIRKQRKPFE